MASEALSATQARWIAPAARGVPDRRPAGGCRRSQAVCVVRVEEPTEPAQARDRHGHLS